MRCILPVKKHPIKIATLRTGLTSHTIRIWEKRYNAIRPDRSEGNRRLYSDGDIAHLQLLHRATLDGHRIGDIAHLSTDELQLLSASLATASPPLQKRHANTEAADHIESALTAIRQLDASGLESELMRADLHLGHAQLVEQVIEPLMRRIGELWHEGSMRIADEHLASAVVRRFIDGIRHGLQADSNAPHLVVTTPAGQMHEIGALLVSTLAAAANWRVTYMGPNLPAEEIAIAAQANRARAVALSIVYPVDDPALGHELLKLRQALDENIAIVVGGRAAQNYQPILARINAVQLSALTDLRPQLHALPATETSE